LIRFSEEDIVGPCNQSGIVIVGRLLEVVLLDEMLLWSRSGGVLLGTNKSLPRQQQQESKR
jgi:hypothetical protein